MTYAGCVTETVVSETSRFGEVATPVVFKAPAHSIEQVAVDPWEAGGVQISMDRTRTDPAHASHSLFATAQVVPAAHNNEVGVRPVRAALVEVNLYR